MHVDVTPSLPSGEGDEGRQRKSRIGELVERMEEDLLTRQMVRVEVAESGSSGNPPLQMNQGSLCMCECECVCVCE